MADSTNELPSQGVETLDAVREASARRLHSILIATAAIVFGHLPSASVTGAGAPARNSIGGMLIDGMAISTVSRC